MNDNDGHKLLDKIVTFIIVVLVLILSFAAGDAILKTVAGSAVVSRSHEA